MGQEEGGTLGRASRSQPPVFRALSVSELYGGMGSIAMACLQLIPIIIYVCYAYTLLFVGAYALAEDYAVSDHACGKTYHLWKFCCINSLLCFFTCLSYCVWRGGGEGARARAMVLTMLYFGFFMWGLLLWQRMSPACSNIFNKQFHTLYVFHHICTCTNGLFFLPLLPARKFFGQETWGGLHDHGRGAAPLQHSVSATYGHFSTPWTQFSKHLEDNAEPPTPSWAASTTLIRVRKNHAKHIKLKFAPNYSITVQQKILSTFSLAVDKASRAFRAGVACRSQEKRKYAVPQVWQLFRSNTD